MKAIKTKYVPATGSRGPRFRASDSDNNSISVPYDYELDTEQNHEAAAYALRRKMGWSGRLVGGSFKGDYYWAFADFASRDARRSRRAPRHSTRLRRTR